jgi:hypothetical protein
MIRKTKRNRSITIKILEIFISNDTLIMKNSIRQYYDVLSKSTKN